MPTYKGHAQVAELVPQVLDRVEADEGGHEHAHPLDAEVERARFKWVSQVLRKPVMPAGFAKETHEQTHPIEMPVKVNQIHQSSSNGLQDGRRASARKCYKHLKALPSHVY
jgi:hypothetical protein